MKRGGPLVFVGSCQAAGLAFAYNLHIRQPDEARAVVIDTPTISLEQRRQIEAAGVIVGQVADMNGAFVDQLASLRASLILFPYVSGFFFWPFATESHPHCCQGTLAGLSICNVELGGDAFLNRQLRAGVSPRAALETYRSLDFERACSFSRRYDLMMSTQRKRDERSRIETAGYIERNLGRDPLFVARGHPTLGLFLHVATQVFDRLGVSSQALFRMEANMLSSPLHTHEVPIHPGLLRRFGYPSDVVERAYQFDGVYQTFDEYVISYMNSRYENEIQDAARVLGRGRDEDIVAILLPRLTDRRLNARVLVRLSDALWRLQRQAEAVMVSRQALERKPNDPQLLLRLGRTQFLSRLPEEDAEPALRAALALRPDHADANYFLARVLETRGRYSEALRHLRRARIGGHIDPGTALRHAWLALQVGNFAAARSACHDAVSYGAGESDVGPILAKIDAAQGVPRQQAALALVAE